MLLVVAAVALTATSTGSAGSSATPKVDTGATLKIAYQYGLAVGSLDPVFRAPSQFPFIDPIYDTLLQTDPVQDKLYPDLATSWTFSKDGKYLTLKLHPGVKFHDGSPVDAAAVKKNLDRYRLTQGSFVASSYASIKSETVVNKTTLRINLVVGQGANLPPIFASSGAAIINPKFFNSDLANHPPAGAGSGPYIFDSQPTPGSQFDFTRAPGKPWQPLTGRAAKLILYSIPTSAAGVNGVQAGTVDTAQVAMEDVLGGVNLVKSDPSKFAGVPYASPFNVRLMLNPKVAPFDNINLRRAVQAALDPTQIIYGEGSGYCYSTREPVGPWDPTYDKKFVNTNPYNVNKVKQYLAAGGQPNGFSFTLATLGFAVFPQSAQIYQAELAKVGIKANIFTIPLASTTSYIQAGQWPALAYGGSPSIPDIVTGMFPQMLVGGPSITVGTSLEAKAQSYYKQLSDPRVSTSARNAAFHSFYKWTNDQAIQLVQCSQYLIYPYTKKLLNAGAKFPSGITNPQFFAKSK